MDIQPLTAPRIMELRGPAPIRLRGLRRSTDSAETAVSSGGRPAARPAAEGFQSLGGMDTPARPEDDRPPGFQPVRRAGQRRISIPHRCLMATMMMIPPPPLDRSSSPAPGRRAKLEPLKNKTGRSRTRRAPESALGAPPQPHATARQPHTTARALCLACGSSCLNACAGTARCG
jgi:hypothetical protein